MSPAPHGVYVHVPWCRRRCPYCAFYVEVDRDTPWDAFVTAVHAEYRWRHSEFAGPASTLYLGGGTPSRLPAVSLRRLIDGFDQSPGAEVTVEANPEDITDEWLEAALAAGVNRLSLGLQTFNPRFARLLNRASTVERARETAQRIAESGLRSWSVDLIFGLPGQTLQDLETDVDAVLAITPPHVSLYGLTVEAGTPLERAVARGQLVPVDDEVWRGMYELLVQRLEADGLARYEISNFARPGHESAHNTAYWSDRPYLGLGPSAHGYAPDGRRWVNVSDVAAYLERSDPTESSEHPDPEQRAMDLLVSAMRCREGLDLALLAARTGLRPSAAVRNELQTAGLLVDRPDRLVLTAAGFPIADAVVRRLTERLVSS